MLTEAEGMQETGANEAVLITTIIVGAASSLVGNFFVFLTLWLKLHYGVEKRAETTESVAKEVSKKIDENTVVTKESGSAAAVASVMAQDINKKLNGGIDSAISSAVDPLKKTLDEHSARIQELNKYVHERSHETVNVLQTQTNQIAAILEILKAQQAKG